MKKLSLKVVLTGVALACGLVGCAVCQGPKRISVLGDSYSTFRGCVPDGNRVYYPRQGNDVAAAEQCWWALAIKDMGAVLERNESYSGSTVCYTGYSGANAKDSSFVTRVPRLGNPDVILVCGATNDSWANAPIGEYVWSDWTEKALFSFRPAMAKMLADLKRGYPKARVVFILNDCLKPAINDSVHEICRHYNVECLDLKGIDKQLGHPSVAGMRTFADQVVAFLK